MNKEFVKLGQSLAGWIVGPGYFQTGTFWGVLNVSLLALSSDERKGSFFVTDRQTDKQTLPYCM